MFKGSPRKAVVEQEINRLTMSVGTRPFNLEDIAKLAEDIDNLIPDAKQGLLLQDAVIGYSMKLEGGYIVDAAVGNLLAEGGFGINAIQATKGYSKLTGDTSFSQSTFQNLHRNLVDEYIQTGRTPYELTNLEATNLLNDPTIGFTSQQIEAIRRKMPAAAGYTPTNRDVLIYLDGNRSYQTGQYIAVTAGRVDSPISDLATEYGYQFLNLDNQSGPRS